MGWITCKEWPSFGGATKGNGEKPNPSLSHQPLDERLRSFEDKLFKRSFEDKPSKDPTIYQMSIFKDKEASDNYQERRERARGHARTASRNFVWLLYGLVPSIPAVIHTHIMGLVYHAELSLRSIQDQNILNFSNDEQRKISGTQWAYIKNPFLK